jgi:hypothetical protein
MKLAEVCRRLHEFPDEETIYARQPWTPTSPTIVAPEPDHGGLPAEAKEGGLSYFIEISLAREFIAAWRATEPGLASDEATCERLIAYATHDA